MHVTNFNTRAKAFPLEVGDARAFAKNKQGKQMLLPRKVSIDEIKYRAVVLRGGGNGKQNMLVFLTRRLKVN